MSYTRDGDRRTRGVGAIAAADNVSRARRLRQSQVHQTTRNRDRAMAAIAQGALGRFASGPIPSIRDGHPVISPPATTTAPPPMYVPPPPAGTAPPVATVPPPIAVVTTPPGKIPPIYKPPAPVVIGPSGGGSSGSGVTLGPRPTLPPIPDTPAPDLPDAPDTAGDHTARNLMIAGGVALGLYFLFRRSS